MDAHNPVNVDACASPVSGGRLTEGRVCYGGYRTLSSTTDITAFVLVFPPPDFEGVHKYRIPPHFGCRRRRRAAQVRDHVPQAMCGSAGLY